MVEEFYLKLTVSVILHTDTIAEYASGLETYSEASLCRICLQVRIAYIGHGVLCWDTKALITHDCR